MANFSEIYRKKFFYYMQTQDEGVLLSIYDDIKKYLVFEDIDTSDVLELHLEVLREFARVEHPGTMLPWSYIENSTQFLAQVLIALDLNRRTFAELALYDPLTSLGNRRLFREISERETTRAQRYNKTFSLILFDLKKFKQINDQYGHEIGDQALKKFAEVMRNSFRRSDSLFRIGGDEFVALLPETDREKAKVVLKRFFENLKSTQLKINGESIAIAANAGIAVFPEDGTEITQLLQTADIKMYEAKKSQKNSNEI